MINESSLEMGFPLTPYLYTTLRIQNKNNFKFSIKYFDRDFIELITLPIWRFTKKNKVILAPIYETVIMYGVFFPYDPRHEHKEYKRDGLA